MHTSTACTYTSNTSQKHLHGMEVDLSRHILPNIFCVIAVLSILFPQWQRVSRLPLHWDKRICWRRLPRLDTAMHYHCKIAESVANQRLPNDLQFCLLMSAFVGGLLRRLSNVLTKHCSAQYWTELQFVTTLVTISPIYCTDQQYRWHCHTSQLQRWALKDNIVTGRQQAGHCEIVTAG